MTASETESGEGEIKDKEENLEPMIENMNIKVSENEIESDARIEAKENKLEEMVINYNIIKEK